MLNIIKKIHQRSIDITLPQRFVFHHVPKCGGTSVGRALRKRYLLSQGTVKPDESFWAYESINGNYKKDQMLIDVAAFREQLFLYLLYDDVRGIALHVPFSDIAYENFSHKYKFITVLREPVSRFISHYFWSYMRANDHARIEEELDQFLETPRARRMGASYVEYYSGQPTAPDLSEPYLIEKSISNLQNRFALVGSLDDLTDFRHQLKKQIGVSVRFGRENNSKRIQQEVTGTVMSTLRERLNEVCAPDIAVWRSVFGDNGRLG